MKITISKNNSKLGVIPSINLPPLTTCRPSCPCAKDCYALKGRFRFPNVVNSMKQNLAAYKEDPDFYFKSVKYNISNETISYKFFRWHAAGDIVDEKYFVKMVELAKELPDVKFLAFTKKYWIVNTYLCFYKTLPSNLTIVFSAWGTSIEVENPYNLPVAYVRFKDKEKTGFIPEDTEECSGNCTTCLKCWNIANGQSVVFNKH